MKAKKNTDYDASFLNESLFDQSYNQISQSELLPHTPGQLSEKAKTRWNELGTLSLEVILANSRV